jgi:hypothetical protein
MNVVEKFVGVRKFLNAKKFILIFGLVLAMLLSLFVILCFWVERVTLVAKPGETITVPDIPFANTSIVKLGDEDVVVDYWYENRPDFTGYYLCENDVISANPIIPKDKSHVTVKNSCSETITIEVYSYSFRLLNAIFDASNGQFRTDSGSD